MGVEANKHIDVRMGIGRSPGQGPFEVNRADAGLLDEMRGDVRHHIPLGLQALSWMPGIPMMSNVSSPLETLLFKYSLGLAQFLPSDERLLDA